MLRPLLLKNIRTCPGRIGPHSWPRYSWAGRAVPPSHTWQSQPELTILPLPLPAPENVWRWPSYNPMFHVSQKEFWKISWTCICGLFCPVCAFWFLCGPGLILWNCYSFYLVYLIKIHVLEVWSSVCWWERCYPAFKRWSLEGGV